MTPLFRASNPNLRPMGVAWFRYPWSAAYITATSARPPNLLVYRTTHRDLTGTTVKGTASSRLLEAGSPQRHLVTQDSRACTVSGPATTLNDHPKSAYPEVFRVVNRLGRDQWRHAAQLHILSESGLFRRRPHGEIQGTVILSVLVTAEGQVAAIYVLKGAPFGLTAPAIKATRNWRMEPAQKDGKQDS